MTNVILVDEKDNPVGVEEKMSAHQKGLLHRAFSIFVFNSNGELLIQKRAQAKYHSGGLWSNTCCGHPTPGEETNVAAHRRLQEEMGFDCDLQESGALLYDTRFDNGLTENEYDHVFVGTYDGAVTLVDSSEIEDWKWMSPRRLLLDMGANPPEYTHWFKLSLTGVLDRLNNRLQ